MLRTLIAALLAAGLAAVPASADHDKGKGKSKGKDKDKGHDAVVVKEKDEGRREVLVFSDRDREQVRTYWVQTYGRGKCPPGLAKKNNGCRPPGLAKERYVVGQRLPAMVVVQPAPRVLVTRLGPPPAGYQYVMVDGDLLKLAVGTRLVVDAIRAVVD
jgi:Ni/Co efflux regulator RcnB